MKDSASMRIRRLMAGDLFEQGRTQAQVSKDLKVSRQTAHRWYMTWKQSGEQGLQGAGRLGRRAKVPLDQIKEIFLRGPQAFGFPNPKWTAKQLVKVIEKEFNREYHLGHASRLIKRFSD